MSVEIEHGFLMDEIFLKEKEFADLHHVEVCNVSHWNSSAQFQNEIMRVMELPEPFPIWDYYYTYNINQLDRVKLLERFGLPKEKVSSRAILLTQSSTLSIMNIAKFIKRAGFKRVCILRPFYFSVSYSLDSFHVNYEYEDIVWVDGNPQIPIDIIQSKQYDAIWLTSPVFCIGARYSQLQLDHLAALMRQGILVISDESLALPGHELIRHFAGHECFWAIYSPHKAISIQGLKFSAIVYPKRYDDFLEQWIDVISGALSPSNCNAIFHYLSDNFLLCYQAYENYIHTSKKKIEKIANSFSNIDFIRNTHGHYITLFFKDLNQANTDSISFFEKLIANASSSFLPGYFHGFPDALGFCFRINLTLRHADLISSVGRIAQFLSHYKEY